MRFQIHVRNITKRPLVCHLHELVCVPAGRPCLGVLAMYIDVNNAITDETDAELVSELNDEMLERVREVAQAIEDRVRQVTVCRSGPKDETCQ